MSPKKEHEDPSMASPEDRPPRSSLACSHCRARKIRCTGGHPCKRCGELKKICEYAKVTAEENIAARARKAAQAARRAVTLTGPDGASYEVPLLPVLPMAGGEADPLDPATGKAHRPRFLKHITDPLGISRAKRLGKDRRSGMAANGLGGSSESPEDPPAQLPLAPSGARHMLDGAYPAGFMGHSGQAVRKQAPPPLRLSTSFGSAPQGGEPGYPEPWSGVSSLAPSPYLRARADSGLSGAGVPDAHPLDFAPYGYHPSSGEESPWLPSSSGVSDEALLQSWLDSSAFVGPDGASPTVNPSALSSSAPGSDRPYWHPDPRMTGAPAGARTPASSSSPVFSTQSAQPPPGLQSSSAGTGSSTESTPMLATPSPDEHGGLHVGVALPSVRPFNGVAHGHQIYGLPGGGLMVDGLELHQHKSALDVDPMPPPHHIPHSRVRHGSHASVSYPLTHPAMVAESRGSPLKHARSWSANLEYHQNPALAMSAHHQPAQQYQPPPPQHQRHATAPQPFSVGVASPQFDGFGLVDEINASMFPGLAGSAFAESAGGLTPGLAAAAAVPPSRRPSLTLAARSCTAPSGVVTLAGFADAAPGPSPSAAQMMPAGSSSSSSLADEAGLPQKWQTPRHDPIDWNPSPFDGRHHSIVSTSSSTGPPHLQHHQHNHHHAAAAAAAAAVAQANARGQGSSFDAANDVALAQQAQEMHLHSAPYGVSTAGGFGY